MQQSMTMPEDLNDVGQRCLTLRRSVHDANQAWSNSTSFFGVVTYRMACGWFIGLSLGVTLRVLRLAPRSFPRVATLYGVGFGLGASYSQVAALFNAFTMS